MTAPLGRASICCPFPAGRFWVVGTESEITAKLADARTAGTVARFTDLAGQQVDIAPQQIISIEYR